LALERGCLGHVPAEQWLHGDYAWSPTYVEPYFEIVGRPPVGLLVVYGAHRPIDGAIKRASAHMDML
jgi:hypothetical protein